MHRITKKDISVVFARFAQMCGHAVEETHIVVGAWMLDYEPCYGGWQVQEPVSGGGVTCPMGDRRMNTIRMALADPIAALEALAQEIGTGPDSQARREMVEELRVALRSVGL